MRPGIGLACFVVEFWGGILAVDYMNRKKIGSRLCCNLDKRIGGIGSTAGFDAVIHQVEEYAAKPLLERDLYHRTITSHFKRHNICGYRRTGFHAGI